MVVDINTTHQNKFDKNNVPKKINKNKIIEIKLRKKIIVKKLYLIYFSKTVL
jgi:hypothetical protein